MDDPREVPDESLPVDAEAFGHIVPHWSWMEQRRLAQELSAFRLTTPQFMVLMLIERQGGDCPMSILAEAAQETSATMTGIVDRLVEHQIVERHRDPSDRRSVLVSLTGRGEQLMKEVEHQRHARLLRLLKNLSPHDRKEMLRLTRLYLEAMTAEVEDEDRDVCG
jgi:DNA-binding MarR family transcriptional regulator